MAEKSSFFNSVNGDRKYLAGDFADFFSPLITNGFFPSLTNLQVIADRGTMDVVIKVGRAWINGYQYVNTSDLILKHDVADGVLNRIDRVVVRLNFIDREITAAIKKGTPASNPLPPTVQRDADIYELGIATVAINAGATSVTQSNVIDTRNDVTVGGIVNNLFAESNAQARHVAVDDLNNYFVSSNTEGVLIELGQPLTVRKTNQDASGIFKTVTFANGAGVTVKKSELSNVDVNGNYLTRTLTFYGQDGSTVMKTITYTRTFNADGEVLTEVIQ